MTKSEFLKYKEEYESFKRDLLAVENEMKIVTAKLYKEENSKEVNDELLKRKNELSEKYLAMMEEFTDVEENYKIRRDAYMENPEEDPPKVQYQPADPNTLHLEQG